MAVKSWGKWWLPTEDPPFPPIFSTPTHPHPGETIHGFRGILRCCDPFQMCLISGESEHVRMENHVLKSYWKFMRKNDNLKQNEDCIREKTWGAQLMVNRGKVHPDHCSNKKTGVIILLAMTRARSPETLTYHQARPRDIETYEVVGWCWNSVLSETVSSKNMVVWCSMGMIKKLLTKVAICSPLGLNIFTCSHSCRLTPQFFLGTIIVIYPHVEVA